MDVFFLIVVLIGICVVIIGGKFGIDWFVYVDLIVGLVVLFFVVKMVWSIGVEVIYVMFDYVFYEEDVILFREVVF